MIEFLDFYKINHANRIQRPIPKLSIMNVPEFFNLSNNFLPKKQETCIQGIQKHAGKVRNYAQVRKWLHNP